MAKSKTHPEGAGDALRIDDFAKIMQRTRLLDHFHDAGLVQQSDDAIEQLAADAFAASCVIASPSLW